MLGEKSGVDQAVEAGTRNAHRIMRKFFETKTPRSYHFCLSLSRSLQAQGTAGDSGTGG